MQNKYKELTNEELIDLFKNNEDRDAYTEIAIRFKDKLKSFAFRYTNDDALAEDLVQETLIKVYKKKHLYKPMGKFSTWIYTIIQNLAITEIRKKSRRGTFTFTELGNDDVEFIAKSPDNNNNNDNMNDKNDNLIIHESLQELDIEFRNIIIFRDIQELSYDEISKIIQIPLGTVKSRINRGRLKLKEIIKKKGVTL
tara:strand:- start:184 stop:774 length:591 start_codon:yes stop_codon:yes gene_type:complete